MQIPVPVLDKGICLTCEDKDTCPMPAILAQHRNNVALYGEEYKDVRPDLWDEESIAEPEFNKDGGIEWCPMHFRGEAK